MTSSRTRPAPLGAIFRGTFFTAAGICSAMLYGARFLPTAAVIAVPASARRASPPPASRLFPAASPDLVIVRLPSVPRASSLDFLREGLRDAAASDAPDAALASRLARSGPPLRRSAGAVRRPGFGGGPIESSESLEVALGSPLSK